MKNISKLVLASLFVVTLAACGSKPAETTETSADSVTVVETTTTPVETDSTVVTTTDSTTVIK